MVNDKEDAKAKAGCVLFLVALPLSIFLAKLIIRYNNISDNFFNLFWIVMLVYGLMLVVFRPILIIIFTKDEVMSDYMPENSSLEHSVTKENIASVGESKQSCNPTERYLDNNCTKKIEIYNPLIESHLNYFDYCRKTAEKVLNYISHVNNTPVLFQTILNIKGAEALDMKLFGKYNTRVVILIFHDLLKCYEGLGYDIESEGMENLFFTIVLSGLKGNFNINRMKKDSDYMKEAQSGGRMMMQFVNVFECDNYDTVDTSIMKTIYSEVGRDFEDYDRLVIDIVRCIALSEGDISPAAVSVINNFTCGRYDVREIEDQIDRESNSHGSVHTTSDKPHGLTDLDQLIGLDAVKEEVKKLSSFVQVQQWRAKEGLKLPMVSYHCVFTGNPGTGKTTVARIIADIYKELGILKKGHLVETDRSGLIAEYVGQTAVKTNKIIDKALDGVLFIDEAYSLVSGDSSDYGLEAISTLLKRMEDDRKRLVVILAGYGEEMKRFININPGLRSRFNRFFHFSDYSLAELMQIFQLMVSKHEYILENDEVTKGVGKIVCSALTKNDSRFGNARYIRNLFEKILENQAVRLASIGKTDKASLQQITVEDIKDIEGF